MAGQTNTKGLMKAWSAMLLTCIFAVDYVLIKGVCIRRMDSYSLGFCLLQEAVVWYRCFVLFEFSQSFVRMMVFFLSVLRFG